MMTTSAIGGLRGYDASFRDGPPNARHQPQLQVSHGQYDHKTAVDSLPAELMVQILIGTPARVLARMRVVSKTFKALIDAQAEAILRPARLANEARIKAEADHLTKLHGVSFDRAILQYFQYYGSNPGYLIHSSSAMKRFCLHWMHTNYPNLIELRSLVTERLERFMLAVITNDDARRRRAVDLLIGSARWFANSSLGQDLQPLWSAVRGIVDVVKADAEPISHHEQTMPNFLMEITLAATEGNELQERRDRLGGKRLKTMARWLWAPQETLGSHFNFRVRDQAIWEMLWDATMEDNVPMVHLKRAAVLEEVFVW